MINLSFNTWGGYILQKLKKYCKSDCEWEHLIKWTDTSVAEVPTDSLIGIKNNPMYGQLTVPVPEISTLLVYLENVFRQHCDHHNILIPIFNSIDIQYVKHLFPNMFSDDYVNQLLVKICRFYLKIRCHQKAKTVTSALKLKSDQNVSFRKSLK
uniref:Uncharacterized protein n=1 Tax=Ciona savignyi TaxID=51511 RepID=H2YJI0_CIOSA